MEILDAKLDRILKQLSELQPIKSDIQDMKNETKAMRTILTEEISKRTEIEEKLKCTDEKQMELENRIYELENKNSYMEKILKQKNILFYNTGIAFSDTFLETKRKIIQLISNNLKIRIEDEDIDSIKKFKSQKDTTATVCVTFCNTHIKNNILANSKLLKGTKISIKRDLTKNEICKEKKALEYLRALKKLGLNVKKVGLNRISLNGKIISETTVSNLISNKNKETLLSLEEQQREEDNSSFLGTKNVVQVPSKPDTNEEPMSIGTDETKKKRLASSPLENPQRSRTFSQGSKLEQNGSKKNISQEESFMRGFLTTSQTQQ